MLLVQSQFGVLLHDATGLAANDLWLHLRYLPITDDINALCMGQQLTQSMTNQDVIDMEFHGFQLEIAL